MRTTIDSKIDLEIVPMALAIVSMNHGKFQINHFNSKFSEIFNVHTIDSNIYFENIIQENIIEAKVLLTEFKMYFKESLFCSTQVKFSSQKWDTTNNQQLKISVKDISSNTDGFQQLAIYFKKVKKKKKANYSSLFAEYADGIFWVVDPQTFTFSFISKQVESILGYTVKEWQSNPTFWADHIHPEDRETAIEFCLNEMKNNRNHKFEYRIINANNEIVWIKDIVSLVHTEEHGLQMVGVMIDITDKKIFEQEALEKSLALEISSQKINQILDQSLDIICTFDEVGKFLSVNNAVQRILGYAPNELIGKNYRDYISEEFILPIEVVSEEIKHSEEIHNFETDYISKTGQIVHLIWSIKKEPVENIFFAVAKDITARKNSEIELKNLYLEKEQYNEKLANSNSELEQFAYVASHDLQEPLRMITGFLHLIEKKYDDQLNDKIKNYIHFAIDGATRMRGIITDLLQYSKIGNEEVTKEIVDLNNLVNNILILHKKQISEINANVIYSDLPNLECHGVLIRQIFQNLISNALKYHSETERPKIIISYEIGKDEVTFMVKDNGIGVPENQTEKIFNIFHRSHSKEKYEGTGMGLAMTKKIIDNLDGEIWHSPNSMSGSTFSFTLPISLIP